MMSAGFDLMGFCLYAPQKHLRPHSLQKRPGSRLWSYSLMQDVEDGDFQLASVAKKRRRAEQDDIEFPDEVRPAARLHTETGFCPCKTLLSRSTVCCSLSVCLDEAQQALGFAMHCY